MTLPASFTWNDLRTLRRRELELADYLLAYGNLDETLDADGRDERLDWEEYRDAWLVMPTGPRSGCALAALSLPQAPVYDGGTGYTPPDDWSDPGSGGEWDIEEGLAA